MTNYDEFKIEKVPYKPWIGNNPFAVNKINVASAIPGVHGIHPGRDGTGWNLEYSNYTIQNCMLG